MNFQTGMFYQMLGVALMNIFFLFQVNFTFTRGHFWAIVNGIAFTVADIAYYKLSRSGVDVSTLGPLTSLYVVVPILLGVTVLKEPVTPKKAVGLFLAVIAIYILSTAEEEVDSMQDTHRDPDLEDAPN
eukprot:CAMPEP_0168562276 /NCGR_PEP_ID=MMETSP0413-20121227/12037_1 /TAXON_ID=136452 /ORGANISM="Filamoeba nolandi, Strain NC-AS-23-1" /LENGTH=128 /DNA_ID=CAMNT_0008593693 /DNA_START=265 /DNA_END=648 /DNA_ORIENTATION=+